MEAKKTENRSLKLVAAGFATLYLSPVLAQKPEIKSIDKVSGQVSEIVTIKGDNFGTDASNLAIFFGAVKGTIESASNQLLEVRVPPGATFNTISTANTANGLTGYGREQFLLSYGGERPFLSSKLQGQFDFAAERGLYDLCMCDFDGDGRVDVATASDNATSIKILPNTSTGPGVVTFNAANPSIPLGTRSLHVKCGDLNGDGKPDLVVSEGGDGNRIFVFRNTSSGIGNFTFSAQTITLTGRKTKRIEIADLDLDGKPELIITDQGSNTVSILVNESTLAAIIFAAAPVSITIPGAASTDGLAVKDINGDNLPEIITSQFQISTSNLYILENKSIPGAINLGPITTLALGNAVVEIRVGDLDGDRKADIAVTQLLSAGLSGSISILRNTSTSTAVTFAPPQTHPTDGRPFGLDLGDLDGDGKADIAVASLTTKTLSIFNNESTPGSLSFSRQTVNTTYINRHVNIGDVDGDGKPDIVFTSIDDNATATLASLVSVFRNSNCMIPIITPEGPLSVCSGFPLRLHATVSRGTTYQWRNESNVIVASGPNPYFDVIVSGEYSVTAIAESGACSEVSNVIEVNVSAGATSGIANPTNNGPLCVGNTLELQVNNVSGTEYRWTGPAGYTGTGLTPVTINNFTLENVGRYYVDIYVGTCLAQQASTVVEAIDIGSFTVTYVGSRVICQGDSKTLTVTPNLPGATYQWFNQTTGLLPGETNPTLTVTSTGDYFARVGYPGCSSSNTDPVNIVVATLPVANFTMPANACTGQLVQFVNESTSDPVATPVYTWTFGDGNTSSEQNPQHTYTSAGTFNAKLSVTYQGGVCPNETPTKPITVQSAPIPVITNPDNTYIFCPGDSLRLEVAGSYNSYLWSTNATTSFIYAKTAGTYTVEVTTNACTLNANRPVQQFDAPLLLVSALPANITEGQASQLQAEGLTTYDWSPSESLSDPSIPNPVANPLVTTTYTVTGKDGNGCTGQATIELIVQGESIVTKLSPRNFFSPNDDDRNQNWTVGNILDYPQCGVAIYDDKGIKVYEAKPYLNDWNGTTMKGNRLPDGVYFFIIRCDGEENTPRTGSITVLR